MAMERELEALCKKHGFKGVVYNCRFNLPEGWMMFSDNPEDKSILNPKTEKTLIYLNVFTHEQSTERGES